MTNSKTMTGRDFDFRHYRKRLLLGLSPSATPVICTTRFACTTSLASPRTMASIDPEITPSHKAACVTDEEYGSTAKFFRRAETIQHVPLGPIYPPFRIRLEKGLGHGCNDIAWGYGVDADTMLAPFRSKVTSELNYGGLGRIICPMICQHIIVVQGVKKHTGK